MTIMNTKKAIIAISVTAVVLSLIFTACKSNESNNNDISNKTLIGTTSELSVSEENTDDGSGFEEDDSISERIKESDNSKKEATEASTKSKNNFTNVSSKHSTTQAKNLSSTTASNTLSPTASENKSTENELTTSPAYNQSSTALNSTTLPSTTLHSTTLPPKAQSQKGEWGATVNN